MKQSITKAAAINLAMLKNSGSMNSSGSDPGVPKPPSPLSPVSPKSYTLNPSAEALGVLSPKPKHTIDDMNPALPITRNIP